VFASVACPTGGTAIANCATCTASSYYVVCETCLNTYYLSSNVCKSCALNFANCLYCALDASQTLQCLTCNANYGLLSGQCLPCSSISGCQTCTIVQNFLLCNSCISPLVLTSTQTQCLACPIANCTSCSSSPSGQFVCSSCSSGYYLSSNACLQCASAIQYCTICQYANSVVTCSTCASTSLYLSNNKCVANCTTAGYPQCLTCQLTSLAGGVITCTTCKDGYFLDLASQTCRGCS
jgi:proprotein convertase subtilisin/kexin type 5